MKPLILMIQFLTRIPLNWQVEADESTFERGIAAFSTVGLILGVVLVAALYWLSQTWLSSLAIAILIVITHIVMTGGLHLDGVADTADGLLSNRSKDEMLAIMKDPRVGSNAVIALLCVLLLKIVAIDFIVQQQAYWGLLLMPMVGRFCVVVAFKLGKTPRARGMGNLFIGKAGIVQLLLNAVPLILVLILQPVWLLPLCIAIATTLALIAFSNRKIDGITGDVLGTIIELSEIAFVLSYSLMFQFLLEVFL